MHGVLVLDKPTGLTSHDVVARVRTALAVRRVGHTGTLDPLATGVLPLVIGRATRLAQFLTATPKTYLATILLGQATDTYDIQGRPLPAESLPSDRVTQPDIERAVEGFRGTYWQIPPPFSARRIDGTRAYALAHRKRSVELPPAEVTVHRIDIVAVDPPRLTVRLRCSPGFYVRALAHELGRALGCGACLAALRREEAAGFSLADAAPLAAIESEGPAAARRIIAIDALGLDMPVRTLTERGSRRAAHGNTLLPDDLESSGANRLPPDARHVRLVDREGALVAVADVTPDGLLHPRVVLM